MQTNMTNMVQSVPCLQAFCGKCPYSQCACSVCPFYIAVIWDKNNAFVDGYNYLTALYASNCAFNFKCK